MKKNGAIGKPGISFFAPLACLALTLGGTVSVRPAATAPADGEPKTHVLFMGVDLDLQQKTGFYRAKGVFNGAFIIKVDGKDVFVPMNHGPVNMQVKEELKLTETTAEVTDLKSERAYTPNHDPSLQFMREQPGNSASSVADRADFRIRVAENQLADKEAEVAHNAAVHPNAPGQLDSSSSQLAEAYVNLGRSRAAAAEMRLRQDWNSAGYYAGKMVQELAKEDYDAMEVTFHVSSPRPLNSPYVVFIAEYRERTEAPGIAHNWVYAQELQPIDGTSRKVRILQGGLPNGFTLIKFQLHLYNHGQEVATTVSDKQVALTRDEAFQFKLIDYVTSHKNATLPASPALGRFSPEDRARLAQGMARDTFYVKVTKDGIPTGVYLDEACSQKVADTTVESLVNDVRFNPALEKGKPIEGVSKLRLTDLSY